MRDQWAHHFDAPSDLSFDGAGVLIAKWIADRAEMRRVSEPCRLSRGSGDAVDSCHELDGMPQLAFNVREAKWNVCGVGLWNSKRLFKRMNETASLQVFGCDRGSLIFSV